MYLLYLRRQFEKYVKKLKSAGGELPDDFPIPFVVPLNTDASRLALFGDPARGQQHMHALNSDHQWRSFTLAVGRCRPETFAPPDAVLRQARNGRKGGAQPARTEIDHCL